MSSNLVVYNISWWAHIRQYFTIIPDENNPVRLYNNQMSLYLVSKLPDELISGRFLIL